jgi:ribokinase
MDIAVIGSNMVDLITYTNQMPKEGETLEAPRLKSVVAARGQTRRWQPPNLTRKC